MLARRLLVLGGACTLDALLGDPPAWPHPVRAMGAHIAWGEGLARRCLVPALQAACGLSRARAEQLAGAAVAGSVALAAPLAAAGAIRLAGRVHPALGLGVELFLASQTLAARSLSDEAMAVHARLAEGDLPAARKAVGRIVGRDTEVLGEAGVVRAAVETVAESTSDGVVAPLLYLGCGGVPAAMFYKAANTADSMLGYKDDRHLHLGRAAAKLDDAANLVPARAAGALMCAAAGLAGFDARGAWRVFRRDRLKHPSPNAGHPEAACAGALGVQLGGPSRYGGAWVEKPLLGDATRPPERADIPRAVRLMRATSLLALGAAVLAAAGADALSRHHGKAGASSSRAAVAILGGSCHPERGEGSPGTGMTPASSCDSASR